MMKRKTIIMIAAVVAVAGIGFAAGMLAKESMAGGNKDIGIQAAKEIALASVGVSAEKAVFTKEAPDGNVYEIDFYTESNEYDFEVDKSTGAITDREVSPRDLSLPDDDETVSLEDDAVQPEQESQESAVQPESAAENSNDNSVIGVAAAKSAALNHAGVSGASFQEASLDYDDGVRVYDIEFIAGDKNYEYEINAYTGAIISYDIDHLDYDDEYDD